jgi:hypothetical protein
MVNICVSTLFRFLARKRVCSHGGEVPMSSQTRPLPAALAARYPLLAIADIGSDTAVARCAAGIRAALDAKDIQVVVAGNLHPVTRQAPGQFTFCHLAVRPGILHKQEPQP